MTWTKLPDDATETLWDLSAGAFRLHVCGLVYCNRHLTDGYVPASRLPALVPAYEASHVAELTAAHLWDAVDSGYQIARFLEDQPSRATVEARRESWRRSTGKYRKGVSAADSTMTPGTGTGDSLGVSPFPESSRVSAADTNADGERLCYLCRRPAAESNPMRADGRHLFQPCPLPARATA